MGHILSLLTPSTAAMILAPIAGSWAVVMRIRAQREAAKETADSQLAAAKQAAEAREAATDKANDEAERKALIAALNSQNQATLQILREELKVQQDNSIRSFELLDRNTVALEKMVTMLGSQTVQITAVQAQLGIVQGAVMARSPLA